MGALDGKVAVVAGASRGIGRGIAVEAALAGATVYVTARTTTSRHDAPVTTVDEIAELGGTASAIQCDYTDDATVAAVFEQIAGEQGRIDLLVNTVFDASQFGATIGSKFWELPLSIWHDVVDVGTRSAYVASFYAAPLLLAAGSGVIVNVSARGASRYRYNVAYGAGKAALDKMTADMAQDLRDHDVAVVSIWPNVTRTENLEAGAAAAPEQVKSAYGDLDLLETPRYSGRAVVALAADPAIMDRSGKKFWVAELGADYGFTDVNGRAHPIPE
jgi:NAD(P)-dependent dehydrogenase (short-subunit alcohol dehydrogenase family)